MFSHSQAANVFRRSIGSYGNAPGAVTRKEPFEMEKISPCTLRLLTPALSSFGEEREKAVAKFVVQGSIRESFVRLCCA